LAAAPVQIAASTALSTTDPNLSTPPSASGTVQALSPIFRPEVLYWSNTIQSWAASAGLDPNLLATVMQIESCGDPRARSGAGAMGLFQVMPYHFATGENPYDPDTNAARGMDYLKRSLTAAKGNPRLALAGYNGGIGVIGRAESSWSGQTQRYAYWGSGIYADASNGNAVSARLQEWYSTSGASLCRQAHNRLGITP
jgi:soluble lytic murein transglycosylase-like protein